MTRFYNSKRRCFILLELVISLGLMMIVLSSLLFFYYQLTLLNTELDHIQQESFEMRYLQNRLADILPNTLGEVKVGKKPYFYFFSTRDPGAMFKGGSPSLILTYDNCVNLEKLFSYRVVGRLFLDRDGRLMLATWPSPKYWEADNMPPMKKEVLLENVDSIAFEFYIAPIRELAKKEYQNSQITPGYRGTWIKDWSWEYRQLPEMIRLTINRLKEGKKETIQFMFPLPKAPQPIIYEK